MNSEKELKIAYSLAIILFIVGSLCYAAFPAKPLDKPVRLMFKGAAGNVLFDHKTHTAESGYEISCKDCHHHPQGDEEDEEVEVDLRACNECHRLPEEGETAPQACAECHEPDEIEDSEFIKTSDAFHNQCIGCHQENESGPEECAECHAMK